MLASLLRACLYPGGVPIISKDRGVMQAGRAGFRSVIPVGWASSPSIKSDRAIPRSARDYQDMTGKMPVLPNRFGGSAMWIFAAPVVRRRPATTIKPRMSLSGLLLAAGHGSSRLGPRQTHNKGRKDEDWEPRLKKYPLFGSLVNFPLIAALVNAGRLLLKLLQIRFRSGQSFTGAVFDTIKEIENRGMQVHKNVRMKQ